ncbi:YdeI/OmpD-associated family protein [Crocinitomix algicola]|uniref:YdeI/OmpD-associated family protein n=1 Tax=Crocinitomix algicola TaxID=1740263 RepID=UPI000871D70B|nr:YdeI/OmpD-associated family protein [Crocinitomix algicola]
MKNTNIQTNIERYFIDGCGRCDLGETPDCKVNNWREELEILRSFLQSTALKEDIKWGAPIYTYNGKNVLGLSALKAHCSVSFFKGSLLKDEKKILHQPGKNSQAVRYFKFTNIDDVLHLKSELLTYVQEAIEIEEKGLKVDFKASKNFEIPIELIEVLAQNSDAKKAFDKLTTGRKRSYVLHVSSAKQAKTRYARAEKSIPKILQGKGFNEY